LGKKSQFYLFFKHFSQFQEEQKNTIPENEKSMLLDFRQIKIDFI